MALMSGQSIKHGSGTGSFRVFAEGARGSQGLLRRPAGRCGRHGRQRFGASWVLGAYGVPSVGVGPDPRAAPGGTCTPGLDERRAPLRRQQRHLKIECRIEHARLARDGPLLEQEVAVTGQVQ